MNIVKLKRELKFNAPVITVLLGLASCGLISNVDYSISADTQPNKQAFEEDVQVEFLTEPTKIIEVSDDIVLGSPKTWFKGVNQDDLDNLSDDDLAFKLNALWDYKLKMGNLTPSAKKNAGAILGRFHKGPKTKMSHKQFINRANEQVSLVKKNLDYDGFCGYMKLNDQKCKVLKKAANSLHGKEMVAYGMTELFPSFDGQRNLQTLDNVLQNAGIEYINSVPALGDPLLSVGMYQFTSYAVRHDANGTEGASNLNRFVKGPAKIPGSVLNLDSDAQHRAAFMFSVYNISRWIKTMDPKQLKTFSMSIGKKESDIVQYIATSHHMPAKTIKVGNAWLNDGTKKSFSEYLGKHLTVYAKKTKVNYEALKEA